MYDVCRHSFGEIKAGRLYFLSVEKCSRIGQTKNNLTVKLPKRNMAYPLLIAILSPLNINRARHVNKRGAWGA